MFSIFSGSFSHFHFTYHDICNISDWRLYGVFISHHFPFSNCPPGLHFSSPT